MASRVIPLFPLEVVLFPGMVLPLRIFEPRYREMIHHCMAGDRTFGVVLAQEAEGEAAVGTLAEISGHEVLPDGQILVVCVGTRRFRTLREVTGASYAQAEVELLEERGEDEVSPPELEAAYDSLSAYLGLLKRVSRMSFPLPTTDVSAADLGYLMAAVAQVENPRKQMLLACPSVRERLETVRALLDAESRAMRERIEAGKARGDVYYRGRRLSLN